MYSFFAQRESWASLLLIFEFKYVHTASSYNIIHEIFEWHKHLQNPTRDKIIIYQKKFFKKDSIGAKHCDFIAIVNFKCCFFSAVFK